VSWLRNRWVWGPIVGLAVLAIIVSFFRGGEDDASEVDFSEIVAAARDGRVDRIVIRYDEVEAEMGETSVRAQIGDDVDVLEILTNEGVDIADPASGVAVAYAGRSLLGDWIGLGINFIPVVASVVIFWLLWREVQRLRRAVEALSARVGRDDSP
jgi:hypothetical protein